VSVLLCVFDFFYVCVRRVVGFVVGSHNSSLVSTNVRYVFPLVFLTCYQITGSVYVTQHAHTVAMYTSDNMLIPSQYVQIRYRFLCVLAQNSYFL
jgi:hypothetical protein